ncbi:hydroxycinnamoyl-CoA:piscidic acid hydroxycinnamoyltransferase-like [Lotus japonicus]|uniref:hydroxycinnamoyl-CoA:piscidic acid hydroxycinnamoyltransferase-like n=1 Tax=Lotus japonicus TaxID=34305 RepID=UPI00258D57EB|nr:hydroxycinnamoyl-CoA:piscidic acid hydroxycinnamoyltransferase-like [Lotus japonicus]
MVTITASHTVLPNQPTPQCRLWLSDMDQVVRQSHTPLLYIYKAKHDHDCIERMKESLSKILVHYYPIAGRLSFTENGRMEIDCKAKGVVLLEAETAKTMADFGDFSPSGSTKQLIPTIDYNHPVEEVPLLVVQLTRFNGDEGLAVGVAWHHTLSDGIGFTRFIYSWAKIARGDKLEPHELPFLDRTLLKFSQPPSAPRFEHKELKPLPLNLGSSDCSVERNKKVTSELLILTPLQVEKLKKEANGNVLEGSRPYSRYEVIGAHIWRCASKARELDQNQPTVVRFNVENRSRMVPPLPPSYFGNALTQTAATGYVGEITSKPLSHVAQKIREAVEVVNDEYIRSQIDVIRCQKHLDDARALFLGVELEGAAPSGVNPNFHFTSWMSMSLYEADFGKGKPLYFGLGYVSPNDRAIILLSPDGDGSLIVLMFFQTVHIQLFKDFFYADISTCDGITRPSRL